MTAETDTLSNAPVAASKFPLGRLEVSARALAALTEAGESLDGLLARHHSGDWGVVDRHDWDWNDHSLKVGLRLQSAYRLSTGVKVWVMTEADRSATTVLLPEEY